MLSYIPGPEPTTEDVGIAGKVLYEKLRKQAPGRFPELTEDAYTRFMEKNRDKIVSYLRMQGAKPLETTDYTDELSEYGELMSVEEFLSACEHGALIDYDGHGNPVKMTRIEYKDGMNPDTTPTLRMRMSRISVTPSARHLIPKDATHVMWYNR